MNEDFVPFELAKKLKEKGFIGNVDIGQYGGYYYHDGEDINVCYDCVDNADIAANEYLRPTISQVLEWLRNDKKIFVVVFIDDDSDYPVTYNIFRETDCVHHHHGKYFALSEWSKCEMAGIEYVIDEMI